MVPKPVIVAVFTVSILLRLLLVPNPGFEADVSFWKSWGLATYDYGIVEGIKLTNNNYPTPFAYAMGCMVWLYSRFADPHAYNQFWENTNLAFLAIAKAFPILADIGIAALILYIGTHASSLGFPILPSSFYFLLSVFFLLNPVSLIDGALWGQVDSLGVLLFSAAFILVLKRRAFPAGFVFMLAMMTKLQNMIYGPLFFLFIWQTIGWNGLIKSVIGATVGFFGLNIEFLLAGNMDRVLAAITGNYDYFPWMSLNAFNLWWIVAKGAGMAVTDKVTILGLLNAKRIGLLIFSSFYLLVTLKQIFLRDLRAKIQSFITGLITINAAFFLFMTQSHDRYLFPAVVFLLLWAPYAIHTKQQAANSKHMPKIKSPIYGILSFKLFCVYYVLLTLFYSYNLHTALVFNYPGNGVPLPSWLLQPGATIFASVVLLALFAVYVLFLIHSSPFSFYVLLCVFCFLTLGFILPNLPLLLKQPIALTKLAPIATHQDYGTLQKDRSVNSSLGIGSWNRLSVQYAFYATGIGTHANSRHVYDIHKNFTRFTTDVGMDTESGLQASAVFEIWGDNMLLYRSDTMKKFDMPRHVDVDVTGVRHLALVTTDAGDGITDDHTDWLRPTLWP